MAVLARLSGMQVVIGNVLYGGALPTALDLHYLLNRGEEVIEKVNRLRSEIQEVLGKAEAEIAWGSVREWLKISFDSLGTWKAQKYQVSQASIANKRKIIKLKWREHRISQAQALLKRRKGQRKQEKLALKKKRIFEMKKAAQQPKSLQARVLAARAAEPVKKKN